MKRILIINEKRAAKAPRLKQLYEALHKEYALTFAVDEKAAYMDNHEIINLEKIRNEYYSNQSFIVRLERFVRRILFYLTHRFHGLAKYKVLQRSLSFHRTLQIKCLLSKKYDLIINHHLVTLPMAERVSRDQGIPLILNAHEYYADHMDKRQLNSTEYNFRMSYLTRAYIPKTDHIFTVSNGIGDRYFEETNVDYSLVRNDKPFYELKPKLTNPERIKFIHHGAAHPLRKIDQLIEVFQELPEKFELNLMLVGSADYIAELKKLDQKKRVKFIKPVALEDIPSKLNEFDVSLFSFFPHTFNLKHVLPNKFFESIQGRLCIITGPSEEMADITDQNKLGLVLNDFTDKSLTEALLSLKPSEIDCYKNNTHLAALSLSSESTSKIVLNKIREMIKPD